jgi:hypothetical protein
VEGEPGVVGDAVYMHVERGDKVEGDAVYFIRMRGEQIRLKKKKKKRQKMKTWYYRHFTILDYETKLFCQMV